jgi:hypothetical protein
MRKYVAHCLICERADHPNRVYEIEKIFHLPTKPGELMTLDLYSPFPTGRGGVKYLLVCLEVFSKHVTLYPLKAATIRGCLNKLRTHYFPKALQRQAILSDQGSQFTSLCWRKTLAELSIQAKYSPIRHPESNSTEHIMRELGKYFRIYYHRKKKLARTSAVYRRMAKFLCKWDDWVCYHRIAWRETKTRNLQKIIKEGTRSAVS